MSRRAFTTLATLSLLLCFATAALWARSYERVDSVRYLSAGDYWDDDYSVTSWAGSLSVGRLSTRRSADGEPEAGWFCGSARPQPTASDADRPHFDWVHDGEETNARQTGLVAPHWALMLAGILPPAAWLRSHRRAGRRAASRHCPACGYDLRATPDRCPECGRVMA